MNGPFTKSEIKELTKDIDCAIFTWEETEAFYKDILDFALKQVNEMEGAKDMIVKVFSNITTRALLTNAVILSKACSDKVITQGALCQILILLAELA